MGKKNYLRILGFFILLGVIITILLIEINPPANQYKNYIISGSVNPSDKIVGGKPPYVSIYYPYYMPEYLCRSQDIQVSAINWSDENNGKYQILVSVPVGLDEVIITTDCSSCEYKKVNLNESSQSVDLIWGSAKCGDEFQISEQPIKVVEYTRNLLNEIERNIVNKSFNSSEIQSIKGDVEKGRDKISESDRITDDINGSLLNAYYAEGFAWRARYKLRVFELKYCVSKGGSLLKSYEDNPCFIPDYNAYTNYKSSNNTYFSLSDRRLLSNYLFSKKEIGDMKKEIEDIHRQYGWVSKSLEKCKDSSRIINGTFEYQKPFCKARQIEIGINWISWAIVFIYLGILIEMGKRIWKK